MNVHVDRVAAMALSDNSDFEDSDISLPNETLSTIFSQLSPECLVQISLVSHRFNAVAERLLYSSIFIRDVLTEASPTPWKTIRCCRSLLQRLHLVESIRELVVRWQVDGESPPHPQTGLTEWDIEDACVGLAQTLPHLTYLISLDLSLGPANIVGSESSGSDSERSRSVPNFPSSQTQPHVIERIIHGSLNRFPHLRNCSLTTEWVKGARPYTEVLPAFLSGLSCLRNLRLADSHYGVPLRSVVTSPSTGSPVPTPMPHLSSFRGSLVTATFLVPGRPVQSLSLVGPDSDFSNRENLRKLTTSTVPIRYLDLSSISVRPVVLRNVADFLGEQVEWLRVRLALRHTLHYAMSGIRLLTGLSPVLSRYRNLTFLDLSPTTSSHSSPSHQSDKDMDEELALCREWGRACALLRVIVFPSQRKWVFSAGDEGGDDELVGSAAAQGVWTPVPVA